MKKPSNKIFAFFFCLGFLFFSFSAQRAQAAWIPAIDPMIKQMMETMARMMEKMGVGAKKQATAMALSQSMAGFIGGSSSGGGQMVRNWTQVLKVDPENETVDFMKNYISETTGGRGVSQYEGFGGNYMSELGKAATKMVSQKEAPQISYEGNPSDMFAGTDGFQKFNEWFGSAHPVAAMNGFRDKKAETEAEKKRLAEVPRIAYQGFEPKGDMENVSLPGSTIGYLTSDINAGSIIDMLAGSDGIPDTMVTAILSEVSLQKTLMGYQR